MLVGYLLVQNQPKTPMETSRHWGYINDLYVVPDHRGRGIGTDLLRRCMEYLGSAGIPHVRLSVWAQNERAMRLYTRAGFKDYMLIMEAETTADAQ